MNLPTRDAPMAIRASWSSTLAMAITAACVLNTYSYMMVGANPLIQSDVWRFLDGYLGRFIQLGFSWTDVFVDASPADTNFPLYKLFLFFHTHYFGMDFRLEGIVAVLSAVACVLLLTRLAATRPIREWAPAEYWLLAGLALALLSLNSTNIYTWPLAGMWYVPILLACIYFGCAFRASWPYLLVSTFFLGVLLDEFAFAVVAATVGALTLARGGDWKRMRPTALGILAGLVLSRIFYKAWELAADGARAAEGTFNPSFWAFLDTDLWKAALFPLSDSVIHVSNLPLLFGGQSTLAQWVLGLAVLAAHAWFWWRVATIARRRSNDAPLYVAVALMLLFYALVAGIVLHRVPKMRFEYLHQLRYVLFYQLNLAALGILFYRQMVGEKPESHVRRIRTAAVAVMVVLFGGLQVVLSLHAWDQLKYISRYNEQAARDMGRLAATPDAKLKCADYVVVCNFPVEKRRRIMSMLVDYRLNVFSPRFQSFHRLYPGTSPASADAAPDPSAGTAKPAP